MKFSVAMCTYNGEPYLPAQFESIAAQTRPADELVVCDDCSTDGTRAIIEAFAARARVPVRLHVNERNLGARKNFERAVALCTGEVIALCDQDDVWLPDKLRRTEEALAAAPGAGLVFSDAEVVDEQLRPLRPSLWEHIGFGVAVREAFRRGRAFEVLRRRDIITGTTLAFRSSFKELVLPIPEDVALIHDGWIALLIGAVGELIMIDEPLVRYRQHGRQQIGARRAGCDESLSAGAIHAAARRRADFAEAIRTVEAVKERLAACGDKFSVKGGVFPSLGAELTHLRARANLPTSKLRRVPYVFQELLARRYHTYSKGLFSAAKDLFC